MRKNIAIFISLLLIGSLSACRTTQASAIADTTTQENNAEEEVLPESSVETVTENTQQDATIQSINTEFKVDEIPAEYIEEIEEAGRVVRMDYTSNTYGSENREMDKYALVYLPYGYDEADTERQYNVFYLMHGGGGNADMYLGGENGQNDLKLILDNLIANGDMEPMIVVTPSFYHDNDSSGSYEEQTANFHHELINDLIPAVEGMYHTYAVSTDEEGIRDSREHRMFGGFSMGSVTTWYTFINCLDYFKYYMPISGDCWIMGQMGGKNAPEETAEYLNNVAQESGYTTKDYYIAAYTGTEDIAYENLNLQVEAMRQFEDTFVYHADFSEGNFYYGVAEGGTHAYPSMIQYIYNALPVFSGLMQDVR